jgi:outer membrane protein TolC
MFMHKNHILTVTAILVLAFLHAASAQDTSAPAVNGTASSPVVSLNEALSEAASSGDDFHLVVQNLAVARLQRSLDLARQGMSLGANGAYMAAYGLGENLPAGQQSLQQTLINRAETAAMGQTSLANSLGLNQVVTGSLALSDPLTKVTLSASQSILPPTASLTSQVSTIGLTATRTVWDGFPGGQFQAALEKSNLALQSKELVGTLGRSAAVAKIKQAYLSMLSAQRDLEIKKQVLDKLNRLLRQVKAIYEIRQASAIDLKTAQINSKSAEIDVAMADKTLRLANERLAILIGRPGNQRFSVAEVDNPPLPAASIDEAIRIGLEKRTDLAQYELSYKSARIDAALAKAQASPIVSLTGGSGISLYWAAPTVSESALSLGAKVTLPILDSGVADLQTKTSAGQADVYNLQAAQLRKTLAADIQDYYESAQLMAEKIDLAKQSAELATAQFELVQQQNKFGTATTQDVLTASVTAATAEVTYGTARNIYLLAELSLETAMGL